MTDIDVPDWVVAVADEAAAEFVESRTMSMYASLDDMRRDCAGHMLRAALSAWAVPESVQFQDPDGGRWWNFSSTEGNDCATSLGWPKRTLYALRQEKPE